MLSALRRRPDVKGSYTRRTQLCAPRFLVNKKYSSCVLEERGKEPRSAGALLAGAFIIPRMLPRAERRLHAGRVLMSLHPRSDETLGGKQQYYAKNTQLRLKGATFLCWGESFTHLQVRNSLKGLKAQRVTFFFPWNSIPCQRIPCLTSQLIEERLQH